MILRWLALLIGLAGPVLADPVRVTSGEHDGFTRLVFDFGRPVDWQVGRTADGYHLRLADMAATYDLTAAFKLIGTSRLAAIWAAPDSGDLHIGLACACHAMPFEFRPGIVVVDLKDGAPPKGSSFETTLEGSTATPLVAAAPVRPRPRPGSLEVQKVQTSVTRDNYDWTAQAYSALRGGIAQPQASETSAIVAEALLPPDPDLQPLRDQIVHQMARGAAQGVVDMARPDGQTVDLPTSGFPRAQIRIGEAATSVNRPNRSVNDDLGARGIVCIAPNRLAIASWGDEALPLINQMVTLRSGLSGEFDRPDPEALARAIKFQLFLGFGAEARQLIAAFPVAQDEAQIWRALSYLMDGLPDPEGIFHGQAACAGPVALWALLDAQDLTKGDPIESGEIRLAFAALPMHLRRLTGPPLAEKLLALGDEESARALSDGITRAPGDPGAAVTLMKADLDLYTGNPADAEEIAKTVLADPGPHQPDALIALTEARVSQRLPLPPEVALALHAHLTDHTGTDLEPRLSEALILAEAASGNFPAAFAALQIQPARQADVWALAADLAPDDMFLNFAVLESAAEVPDVTDETAAAITRRLTGLGLGAAAATWLATIDQPDPLLTAEVALGRADGRAALTPLARVEGEGARTLRLQALTLLGADRLRADILAETGDFPSASAALARAGDWEQLVASGEDPWKSLAARLRDTPGPPSTPPTLPYGPLARGHDLAAAGVETRAAIDELLNAVPTPMAGAGLDGAAVSSLK